jgi:hypothetical protein
MADPFTPLKLPASPGATDPHAVFKPTKTPGPNPTASSSTAANAPSIPADQPKITVVREGDRISQIRIQCVCGQFIEIQCQY